MAINPVRVKALFQAAIERADPAERRAFLDIEVGDDAELRERLDGLLAAHDRPPGVLDRPLDADPDTTVAAPDATRATSSSPSADEIQTLAPPLGRRREEGPMLPDTVIAGRYKIRQEIAEGGMGSVYLAEQMQPVRRKVALKLIKPGMDSRNVLARFESERQALALMDHPHIAKVLDAGTTEGGRPFFVMEFVKGIALTEYCDAHRLDLPARLALFRQICSAVQHAHQKGIIHRDLKPSNILVESHDDKPVPKVIDFGLAKATSGMKLSDHSLFTAFGNVTGTPLYMAPEQASFNALDVDTRADIYALGVILYELLTGSTPIRRDSLKRAALDEMLRVIREDEPPTPSSRISTSEGLPSIAANRHIEPARLSRFVRGDLDWIVMKALSKERSRRYDSAIGLANDVERFTNHEPVSAGPPSASYRFRKFVQRNRGRVLAASLVLLALVGGIIGTTLGLFEADRQKRLAITQERETRKRLEQRDKANTILLSIFTDLNPRYGNKETLPLSDRLGRNLDLATAALEGEAIDDPVGVARMQWALGKSQIHLGYAEKGIALLTKARATFTARLGPDHPDTLTSMATLAEGYELSGQLDRSVPLDEETLARRKTKLGPDHPATLKSMNNLAMSYKAAGQRDRALPLLEETLALMKAKLGPDDPDTIVTMVNLAEGYRAARVPDRALPLYEEALPLMRAKLGPDHPDTLTSMNNLAFGYLAAGKLDRVLPLLEETQALRKAKLGPDHPDTLSSMRNLASGYEKAGKLDRALPLWEQALALQKAKLGPDHPETLTTMYELAGGYMAAGQLDRALPLHEETLALRKAKLGPDHPDTLQSMNDLAAGYWSAQRLDRSIPLFEEVLKLRVAKSGNDHPDTWLVRANLGANYQDAGRLGEALPLLEGAQRASRQHFSLRWVTSRLRELYGLVGQADKAAALLGELEETVTLTRARLGADHPDTLESMNDLAGGYWSAQRLDRSIPLFEEVVKLRVAKFGNDHPDTWYIRANLGVNYRDAGRLGEALPLLEGAQRVGRQQPARQWGWITPQLLETYVRAGQADKAATLAREMVAEGRSNLPAGSLKLAGLLAQTGLSLLKLKAWADAEPLLRECLALREGAAPDAWSTFNTKSMLGETLLGREQFAEAEPLLRAGYEGLKARADTIPPVVRAVRLGEALDRLIALGEVTGKVAEVKAWKAERAKWPTPPTPAGKTP